MLHTIKQLLSLPFLLHTHTPTGAPIAGMSFDQFWVYSGGDGVAGLHGEDGFLHFMNLAILLSLTMSPALDPLGTRVLQWVMRYGGNGKQWLFAPSR